MSSVNLALRFLLELTALGALGYWGWAQTDSWWRVVSALAVVLFAAVLWGTFAVANDSSRGGSGLVQVPGLARLALELLIFGAAAYALKSVGRPTLAIVFTALVLIHYVWSHERIAWLIKQ